MSRFPHKITKIEPAEEGQDLIHWACTCLTHGTCEPHLVSQITEDHLNADENIGLIKSHLDNLLG